MNKMEYRVFFLTVFIVFSLTLIIRSDESFNSTGVASWYVGKLNGGVTASGERYDIKKFTAAHRTLEFGTKVKVINPVNGRHVVVTITDRGPFVEGRIIDLSKAAAAEIGLMRKGVGKVRIEVIDANNG